MYIDWLYNNALYSDLTIRLSDGRDIHFHKVVICTNNGVFHRLCQNNSTVVKLSDDDPTAIEMLLRDLYEHNLDKVEADPKFLATVQKVANKYQQRTLIAFVDRKIVALEQCRIRD